MLKNKNTIDSERKMDSKLSDSDFFEASTTDVDSDSGFSGVSCWTKSTELEARRISSFSTGYQRRSVDLEADFCVDWYRLQRPVDAIFVLTGGLQADGSFHPWIRDRLDYVKALWDRNGAEKIGKVVICGGGTPHKPPVLNDEGYVVHEATAYANYLLRPTAAGAPGIPANRLLREWSSYDTVGNAYFGLMNAAVPFDLRNVLVVTNSFHVQRTRFLFDWVFDLYAQSTHKPAKFYNISVRWPPQDAVAVQESVQIREIFETREEREKNSLKSAQETAKKIATFREFAQWLFFEHKCYNCDFESGLSLLKPEPMEANPYYAPRKSDGLIKMASY